MSVQVEVRQYVGEQGQDPVADRVPEVQHAMRAGGEKADAIDNVGPFASMGLQERRILCRIVLEIGILDNDEIPRSFPNAAAQGRTFPHVLRLKQNSNLGVLIPQLRKNLLEPSREPSSTQISSISSGTESTLLTTCCSVARSLYTGMTTKASFG